jgi:hypothetical protein
MVTENPRYTLLSTGLMAMLVATWIGLYGSASRSPSFGTANEQLGRFMIA